MKYVIALVVSLIMMAVFSNHIESTLILVLFSSLFGACIGGLVAWAQATPKPRGATRKVGV